MLTDESQPICGILYVDDEKQALKLFRIAVEPKFAVFTAETAAEGLEILRREPGRIGMVLSDQRMPEMLGADFLGVVREEFPHVVRILTTAYTDLDSAIAAVNCGHIYQYVVKPWDLDDLGMVLQRAADYFLVISERNELLAMKMTTLQRLLCSDRVKWLLLHAGTLPEEKRPAFLRALAALIKAMPERLHPVTQRSDTARRRFEISGLIRDEFSNATRCLDLMATFPAATELDETVKILVHAIRSAISAGDAPALEIAPGGMVRLAVTPKDPTDAARLEAMLFGVLTEPETSALGVAMLQTLVAVATTGGELNLSVGPHEFVFSLAGEPDSATEVIDALYEKFSATDISRL